MTLESNDGTIVSGQWTHVAATYDGSQMCIYKDGMKAAGGMFIIMIIGL